MGKADKAKRPIKMVKKCKTFAEVTQELRAMYPEDDERRKGEHFERIMVEFFRKDKRYEWMKEVRLWPKSDDLGIDIIAYDWAGEPWAIQSKFFGDNDSLNYKGNITNLWAEAEANNIQNKIIVTTGIPTKTLIKQCEKTNVYMIRRSDLESSNICWDIRPEKVTGGKRRQLRDHQKEALRACQDGFKKFSRGQLIMACGTGKTMTALHVAEKETGEGKLVLYLVPSISLIKQTYAEWQENSNIRQHALIVCSDKTAGSSEDISVTDLPGLVTTDVKKLRASVGTFQKDKNTMNVVFSTYQSADVVAEVFKDRKFDLIIFDEAHRTAGREGKSFGLAHDDANIRADKRLYMTATPRIYNTNDDSQKVVSMNDETIFGPQFHRLGFGKAIQEGILSDYQAIAFKIVLEDEDKKNVNRQEQKKEVDEEFELQAECKLSSVYEAIKRREEGGDFDLLNRVLVFHNSIPQSKRFVDMFQKVVGKVNERGDDAHAAGTAVNVQHVDGKDKAKDRAETLEWLKKGDGSNVHVLSSVRCLSEGVNVPTLNGVVFYEPRQSVIDIVQAVGRVMRKTADKSMGYVIIPIVVSKNEAMQTTLDKSGSNKLIVQIVDALRTHDERIDRFLNQASLVPSDNGGDGGGDTQPGPIIPPQIAKIFDSLPPKLLDTGFYWEEYGQKLGEQAKVVALKARNRSDGIHKNVIDKLHENLKVVIGETVTRDDAIDAIAQHIVLQPVFHELFGKSKNPVAKVFDKVVGQLDFHTELEGLAEWHNLMRYNVSGIENPRAKQTVIAKIYGNFFETFDKAQAKTIVYTPVEVVDFIINSVQHILKTEFSTDFAGENVRVLDPFAGTGIFLARLMESGYIPQENLKKVYQKGMEFGELKLLAYYTACANLETTYARLTGKRTTFKHGCLADTFTIDPRWRKLKTDGMAHEQSKLTDPDFKNVYKIRDRQRGAHIHIIITNPPWSAGKKIAGEGKQNTKHTKLEQRIKETYIENAPKGNVRQMYNEYIKAIRWASDRIGDTGVIGFITPSAWITGNAEAGIRACLQDEFTNVHILDLKGQRGLKGHGNSIFGNSGTEGGVTVGCAVTVLVKNPNKPKCKIHYHTLPENDFFCEEKRARVAALGSIKSISKKDWNSIKPDEYNDWLNQRGKTAQEWEKLVPIGSKEGKNNKNTKILFAQFSLGLATHRDAWVYNRSKKELLKNMKRHIDFCNAQKLDNIVPDPKQAAWNTELTNELKKLRKIGKTLKLNKINIRTALFRPFFKQLLYFDPIFVTAKYRIPFFYPTDNIQNLSISIPDKTKSEFSPMISEMTPDLEVVHHGQTFPFRTKKNKGEKLESGLQSRVNPESIQSQSRVNPESIIITTAIA